jgi:hypothetical protein
MTVIHGQEAWVIENGEIELNVSRLGAQMAPVVFDKRGEPFNPYYISPWQGENLPQPCPVLVPLRGDFFCLPFGGNGAAFRGQQHPPHGETSGEPWTCDGVQRDGDTTTLALSLETRVRPGRVERQLSLVAGHPVVYSRTVIHGFAGPTPLAHHAILAMPRQEGAVLLSTSSFRQGFVYPGLFSDPTQGEYQSLRPHATFAQLSEVPSRFVDEPPADCSTFPARPGYCDLVQTVEDGGRQPSWVAAVNTADRWLWFALKNARLMPSRVFWMENRGRHSPPWNGRNCCLGIEDGCMYFDRGLAEAAAANPLRDLGVATALELDGQPTTIPYIQGAVRVPADFGRVVRVDFAAAQATFSGDGGRNVSVKVNLDFLHPATAANNPS